jgi:hypothetical protein
VPKLVPFWAARVPLFAVEELAELLPVLLVESLEDGSVTAFEHGKQSLELGALAGEGLTDIR